MDRQIECYSKQSKAQQSTIDHSLYEQPLTYIPYSSATSNTSREVPFVQALITNPLRKHESVLRHSAHLGGAWSANESAAVPAIKLVPEVLCLTGEGGVPAEVVVAARAS